MFQQKYVASQNFSRVEEGQRNINTYMKDNYEERETDGELLDKPTNNAENI